jgi:hypothetical protein
VDSLLAQGSEQLVNLFVMLRHDNRVWKLK